MRVQCAWVVAADVDAAAAEPDSAWVQAATGCQEQPATTTATLLYVSLELLPQRGSACALCRAMDTAKAAGPDTCAQMLPPQQTKQTMQATSAATTAAAAAVRWVSPCRRGKRGGLVRELQSRRVGCVHKGAGSWSSEAGGRDLGGMQGGGSALADGAGAPREGTAFTMVVVRRVGASATVAAGAPSRSLEGCAARSRGKQSHRAMLLLQLTMPCNPPGTK